MTAALNTGTIERDVWNDQPLSPTRNRGWSLATAVAALVVLIGTACGDTAESTTTTSTSAPPTTQTPPTSQAPPTTQAATTTLAATTTQPAITTTAPTTTQAAVVDPANRAVIDSFITTFNAGDPEAIMADLSPDALVWNGLIAGGSSEDPLPISEFGPLIERWLRFLSVQETEMSLESCSPRDGDRINCRGTFSDAIVAASPLPAAGLSVTFEVNEADEISYFFVRANDAAMIAAYQFFIFWLEATHPGEDAVLFDGTGRPSFADEALSLWATRVPEWIASLDE